MLIYSHFTNFLAIDYGDMEPMREGVTDQLAIDILAEFMSSRHQTQIFRRFHRYRDLDIGHLPNV